MVLSSDSAVATGHSIVKGGKYKGQWQTWTLTGLSLGRYVCSPQWSVASSCRRGRSNNERHSISDAETVTIAQPIAVDESLARSQGIADNEAFTGGETFTGDEGRAGFVSYQDEDAVDQ